MHVVLHGAVIVRFVVCESMPLPFESVVFIWNEVETMLLPAVTFVIWKEIVAP